jgi:3-methylcrotonyl-CoA carboxylase alpha subunit
MTRFSTLLIANRGEIACRIIRTCRTLGIRAVAVYSDADANAEHVRQADQAVHIGGSRPADSYLQGERIIAAALSTGAQAIHPGFGFLSENADFADAVERAGLIFIGPKSASMRKMGSKAGAKQLMQAAGVPVVPGYQGEQQDTEHLYAQAQHVGFPLMIKAAHGGGGKGMRIVRQLSEFTAALESCQREALGAFGRDRVLLERYIETPRHIEIQIFGDTHGQVFHLNERECSVQRRYQKIIEESPSPVMTPELRGAMGAAAIKAGHAIDYVGAGTVEFIVGADGQFYFMEINTRLQVEHPVTELCLGLDLVETQIRVAEGMRLPWQQDQLIGRGHAIEVRLYAEDPETNFLPASGPLVQLEFPDARHARIDSGVVQGNVVSVFYDPMIAKLIVHANDRAQAIAKLSRALRATAIVGIKNNIDFLEVLIQHPDFINAKIDTGYLDRALHQVYQPAETLPLAVQVGAVLMDHYMLGASASHADSNPWNDTGAWRVQGVDAIAVRLDYRQQSLSWQLRKHGAAWRVTLPDGKEINVFDVQILKLSGTQYSINGKYRSDDEAAKLLQLDARILGANGYELHDGTRRYRLQKPDAQRSRALSGTQSDVIRAPMPGRIVALKADVGSTVTEGQELIVMEAMKMELSLKAAQAGHVAELRCKVGDFVEADTILIKLAS